jgi:membrane protein YqaA with SNARE-associated domain
MNMELDSSLSLWTLFASAFVSATLAPGGSEAVLAYLAAKSEWAPGVLLLTATAGNTLGALTTWGLGVLSAMGYPVDRLTKNRHGQRALDWLRRWGTAALLLSWLPLIGDALCFAAGWLRLPFFVSFVAILLGKAVRYAAVIYAFI